MLHILCIDDGDDNAQGLDEPPPDVRESDSSRKYENAIGGDEDAVPNAVFAVGKGRGRLNNDVVLAPLVPAQFSLFASNTFPFERLNFDYSVPQMHDVHNFLRSDNVVSC